MEKDLAKKLGNALWKMQKKQQSLLELNKKTFSDQDEEDEHSEKFVILRRVITSVARSTEMWKI